MARKRYSAEEIIGYLRQAEVLLAQGVGLAEVVRKLGVTSNTYYRWRKEYGGLGLDQARRLKELEQHRDAPSTPMTAQALDAPQQFGLFAPSSAALDALAAIDPDDLTPKQALEALYRLKALH